MFENLKVEWVPGHTPTVFLYGPNQQLMRQSEVGDKDLGELLELLKQNNFEPARKKVDMGSPIATGSFNDNIYEVYSPPAYFDDAKAFTESKQLNSVQGHLLTLSSAEEENYVSSLLNGTPIQEVWLGAQDTTLEGTWKWVSGANENTFWQDGQTLSYTHWKEGEPNNVNNEDCATFVRDSGWNDVRCDSSSFSVIVKYPGSQNGANGDAKAEL